MATKRRKRLRNRKWKHRSVQRSIFLLTVRERLENDVAPYFKTIQAVRERNGRGIGFWALARMLFPVIEAVATVIYRKEGQAVRVLRRLGLDYPNLVWQMYRNTLMHNDEMASACYMGRRVTWEIGLGTGHASERGHLRVDAKKLYDDLLAFLAQEASAKGSRTRFVWVRDSFRFGTGFARTTLDEVLRLGKR